MKSDFNQMAFGTSGTNINANMPLMSLVPCANQNYQKMNEWRYILASNKVPKTNCPHCGARKHWQLYIDTETGDVLPEQHGRCDNEQKCGQWVTPKDTGYAKKIWEQENDNHTEIPNTRRTHRMVNCPQPQPEPVCFDSETFLQTLEPERYKKNMFIQNLLHRVQYPFEASDVTEVIKMYRLGTVANGYRAGAATFPFIDKMNRVIAIQVKQFDESNHTISTDFLHSIIEKYHSRNEKPLPEWLEAYTKQDTRVSCLFGEHLLSKYPFNPVALVEAPKTAVYGTLYFGFPENTKTLIWLAVYNKSSFSLEKNKVYKEGIFIPSQTYHKMVALSSSGWIKPKILKTNYLELNLSFLTCWKNWHLI